MPVDASLVGRTVVPTEPFDATSQRIADFAEATGSLFDGQTAPATFPIVLAFSAMLSLMRDPDVGISLHRVIHGEQRFTYTRPVVAGDRLSAVLTVESVRSLGGADLLGTRTEISDRDGRHVCTAFATLVHRGDPARDLATDPHPGGTSGGAANGTSAGTAS
jgi:hypothetical protein